MKRILLFLFATLTFLAFPKVNLGQTPPNLGTTSGFALFTAVGAFNNTGASVVTGDVGTHVGAFNAFPPGSLLGEIHVADPTSAQAATDVATAYSNLTQGGTVIGVGLGNGQILTPGIYQTGAASTLNGNLTLDGQDNPDALFIIRIGGAFATGASSNVILTNSASLCNVYWQINGKFDLGDASVFRGTLVADGAITLLEGSSLLGRGLSKAGAISLNNNIVNLSNCSCLIETPTVGTITQPTCDLATGSVVLSGLPAGDWTINPGSVTGSTASVTISGLAAGTYNFTVTNAAECISLPSAEVAINAQPATPAAPTVSLITQPTCDLATGSVVLSGLPDGDWTINPGSVTGSTASVTISGLAVGTYNFTVTNAAGCISLESADVVINDQPATPAAPTVGTITQPTCDLATGSVVLSGLPIGGWTINPGSVTGSTGSTTTISGLDAGTYNFTVTNEAGCISLASAEVVINDQPATQAAPMVGTITQPTCDLVTGSVVLSGLPAGDWTINPGSVTGSTATVTISGLAVGTHNFTVTNAAGCISLESADVVIDAAPGAPEAPTVGTITQPTCDLATGSVVLSGLPAGGWTINPGSVTGSTASTTTISGLDAGTYNFTVTNEAGCISLPSAEVVINAQPATPAAPTVTTITQSTCELATGSVVLTGLPAGDWTINPGSVTGSTASMTISGLAVGTHNFTVTNAAGCMSLASADVVINAAPGAPEAPTVGTITQPTCDLATGSVVLSGLPAGDWTINPGSVTGSTATVTISGLAVGTYNFTVTNAAGCISLASADVVINPAPGAPEAPMVGTVTQPTCDLATGSVVLSGLPAGDWTISPGSATGSTATVTISGLAVGTYNFTVTNAAGCMSLASADVVINAAPSAPETPTVGTITQPTCELATGSVVLSGLPAGNWTINPGAVTGSTATVTISGLAVGTHNFTVTNTAGCMSLASADVVINAAPSAPETPTVGTITQPTCALATGSVVLSGLPDGDWTINPGSITGSTATATISGLAVGTHNFTMTNSAGCISLESADVVINAAPGAPETPQVGTITQPTCALATGSVVLSGLPDGDWTINPGSVTGSTASTTISGLVSGTYQFTVTNAALCTSLASANVVINAAPGAPAAIAGADRTICLNSNTMIGATAFPGSTYNWTSVPAGFTSTVANPTVTPLLTTTYTVTETITATGCTNNHSVVVTLNPLPAAVVGTDKSLCGSGSAQIGGTAVVGNTYSWTSVPAGFTSTIANPTVTPMGTTTYTVVETITATGCTNSHSVVIRVNLAPSALAGDDRTICLNTNTQIGASAVVGSTYSWSSSPAGFTSTVANPTVSPLVTTTYRVVETITATGCTNSTTVVVIVKPIPAAVAGADRAICMNETTQIGAAAVTGSTYNWSSSPAGFTSTTANPTVSPNVTTTYSVVETNAVLNCTNSHSVVVTVNPTSAAVAGADRTICQNTGTQIGEVAVDGSTYSWSSIPAGFTSTEANPMVTPLLTTTYTVVESNPAISCSNSNSVVVTVNPLPEAIAGGARAICINEDTNLGASAVTGSTYSWSSIPAGFTSSMANPTVAPLVTTTYTVEETITTTGCVNKNIVVVSVNPKPAAVAGANKAICMNESTQIGGVAVIGSTYSWSSVPAGFTSNEANPTVAPLVTTTYILVETNSATGCTNSRSAVVTVNPLPAAIAGTNKTICINTSTQIGAAAVNGSTYSWSSAPAGFTSTSANPTVTPLVSTNYTVVETITASGCTNSNSVAVTISAATAAVAGADRSICLNESTLLGAAAVTGSTYVWTSVPAGFNSTLANPTVSPLVTTTYTVVETNAGIGCQNTNTVKVSLSIAPNIIAQPADQTACVESSASFSVNATGAGLIYQWRKGTEALANGGNITGATSATLTIYPVKTSDAASAYNVLITGACSSTEISDFVTLTVNLAPSISTSACVGNSVSFSASATGTGLTYQWRKGDVDLTDGGNISGSNSPTLTINPVSASNASPNYNVLINGACSPDATSLNIGLVVNSAMSITAEPTNQVACVGNSAIFSVGATGTGLTYQWRKGTVNLTNVGNISGATSATLTINAVSAADVASDYNVVVAGPCSPMGTSKPASLSLCIPTGSSSIGASDTNNAVSIYPNPFTSSLDIKVNDVSKISNYELKIYNILGEEVINTLITKDITNLKTSNLTSGIYLYKLISNNLTIQSGKLISQQ